ncbi:metallophosphatase [Bacteroidia bacterium]|nr:metallophosphatase [Bacteroidia bacterium]
MFAILYLAFLTAMMGRNVLPLGMQKILYPIGTVWMGFMLYLTVYFLITDIGYVVKHLPPSTVYRRVQLITGYVLVSILLVYGNYQFNHPKIVEHAIAIHREGAKKQTLKIVAVSDFHLGVQIDKKQLHKYVQLINAQQPDVILIAGDLIDNNILPLNLEKMEEEINRLQAPLGIYFCLGNHEYLSGIEGSKAFLRKTNLTVLVDSVATIADDVQIIGRDDKQGNPNRLSLKEVKGIGCKVEGVCDPSSSTLITILLDHEPYNLEEAEAAGIDLQFSGHTHHGQVFPFNKLVEHLFEVGYGYKQKGNTGVYVTSGLGLWGPPFRIGTQSEIVVVKLVIN